MKENYIYIEPEKARQLLAQIENISSSKRGIDSCVYLIDDYAVLTTNQLKLRNVTTRDDDLTYFNELIETLMELHLKGVGVVPILGYCFNPCSKNGKGYIFQKRAKGNELYDDAIMKKFYAPSQAHSAFDYLFSDVDERKYILERTNYISKIPQKHFDKFIADIIALCDKEILIDFLGKSNFFYDENEGFQFIDLNSHTDYRYGLSEQKTDSKAIAAMCGFTPCHLSKNTKIFSRLALDPKALLKMSQNDLIQLSRDNKMIFEKCKAAMLNNGINENKYAYIFEKIEIFDYTRKQIENAADCGASNNFGKR